MKALLKVFLLTTVVAGPLLTLPPAAARADEYWNGYWGWYDGTYVPYYGRRYAYSGPAYGYAAPAYGYSYGPAYGYGYGAPYGAYYGVPRAGVSVYPGGAAVRVGPARIGWR